MFDAAIGLQPPHAISLLHEYQTTVGFDPSHGLNNADRPRERFGGDGSAQDSGIWSISGNSGATGAEFAFADQGILGPPSRPDLQEHERTLSFGPQDPWEIFPVRGEGVGAASSDAGSASSLRQKEDGTIAYSSDASSVQKSLSTPEQVMTYMDDNFTYVYRGGWDAYSGPELNTIRSGDCKDFACFMGWALEDDNWPVSSYVVAYGPSQGHAFTIFQGSDGKLYMQSNLDCVPVNSLDNALDTLKPYLPGGTIDHVLEYPQGYDGEWRT